MWEISFNINKTRETVNVEIMFKKYNKYAVKVKV
jgi:hypothetical protein